MTPFGITWTNEDGSVCQTGYVFASVAEAEQVGRRGPDAAQSQGITVDAMVHPYPVPVRWADIQTEDDTVSTVEVTK